MLQPHTRVALAGARSRSNVTATAANAGRPRARAPLRLAASASGHTSSSASSAASTRQAAVAAIAKAGLEVAPSQLPTLSAQPERVQPLLDFLQEAGLQRSDVQTMLVRCPRLFSFSLARQVLPVVEWLQELGFSSQQVAATVRRFPQLFAYCPKAHLTPHLHYLKSLGLTDAAVRELILARPHVLGASIELVITYLHKWLRIERAKVGGLLFTYPLDYSLPRLMPPSRLALPDAAGKGGAGEQPEPQPAAPLGSAERCSWLPGLRLGPKGQLLDDAPGSGDAPDSSSGGGGAAPSA